MLLYPNDVGGGEIRANGVRVDMRTLVTDPDFVAAAQNANVDTYAAAGRVVRAYQECRERETMTLAAFKAHLGCDHLFEALGDVFLYVNDDGVECIGFGAFMTQGLVYGLCHHLPVLGG